MPFCASLCHSGKSGMPGICNMGPLCNALCDAPQLHYFTFAINFIVILIANIKCEAEARPSHWVILPMFNCILHTNTHYRYHCHCHCQPTWIIILINYLEKMCAYCVFVCVCVVLLRNYNVLRAQCRCRCDSNRKGKICLWQNDDDSHVVQMPVSFSVEPEKRTR